MTALRTYCGFAQGLAAVFAAVLLLRSLVPAGYMIDPAAARSGELAIILCDASAASTGKHINHDDPHAAHHHGGMHHDDSKGPHESESLSCGLAAATVAVLTPDAIAVAVPQDFAAAPPEAPALRRPVGAVPRPAQARAPPLA